MTPRAPPRARPRRPRTPTNPRAEAVLAALLETREVVGFPLAYRLSDLRRGTRPRASTGLTTLVRAGPPLAFAPAADDAAFAARLREAAPFLAPGLFRAGGGELVLAGVAAGALLACPAPPLAGFDLFRVGPAGAPPSGLLAALRGDLGRAWGGVSEAAEADLLTFSPAGGGAPPLRLHLKPLPSVPAVLAAAGGGPAGVAFTGDRVFLSAGGRLAAELGLALAAPFSGAAGFAASLAAAFLAGFPLVFPGLPPPEDPPLPGAFPGLVVAGARRLEPHLFAADSALPAKKSAPP